MLGYYPTFHTLTSIGRKSTSFVCRKYDSAILCNSKVLQYKHLFIYIFAASKLSLIQPHSFCGEYSNVSNVHFYLLSDCNKGTTYKSACKFHCIQPARMVGVNNWVTCLADGLWSAAKASCHLYCPAPQLVDNSYALDYKCDANHMKAIRENEMGTECK